MKTRKVAAFLPLLASIGLGIVALAVPFLLANHYIIVEGARHSADSYLFFLWGKYYTVAGSKMIQSQMILYTFGDFPMYAMVTIVIGILFAVLSMFSGRGIVLGFKGREFKFKLNTNPIWLQFTSLALLLGSYLYLREAVGALVLALIVNNYVVEHGPAVDFLLGSIFAMVLTIILTLMKLRKENVKESLKIQPQQKAQSQ